MLDLIRNIKFKDTAKSCFQRKLDADIKNKIKKPDSLLIPADKTTNYYAMNTTAYNKLIKENVTKTYKKPDSKVAEKLNAQSARIAVHLNLDDRIEKLAEKEAFITLKDHKPTFNNHPTCHLINPSKSEIGVISKQILDDINTAIINKTQINQWKNTSSVLKWFNGLQHKETLSFICFDVCDFYPSITEKLLCKALDFANSYRPISAHERDIIIHAKRSLLFSDNIPWEKKASNDRFDVTMGSFDGAETCELVGCYMSCVTTAYLLVLSINGIANIFYLVRTNSTVVMLSLEYTRDRTSSNDSTFNQNVFESGTGEPLANCSKESTNGMKRSHP